MNSDPHIGHLYTAILACAIKQTNIINNKNVFMSTGIDGHCLKIQQKAKENKMEQISYILIKNLQSNSG